MTVFLIGVGSGLLLWWLCRVAPASARKPVDYSQPPDMFMGPGLGRKRPKDEHMAAFMKEVMRRKREREEGEIIE